MKQSLYCIRCEKMVEPENELFGHVVLITGETPQDADIDVCEFPDGFASCPPPEFDMDEWLETAEPPSDELCFFLRKEKVMYQNVNTGEVWELNHVEEIPNNPKPIKVYVFKNGERWMEDLFFRNFRKVGEA